MPETAAAVYSWWTTVAVAGTTITYGTIITTAIAVYGAVDAKSKARQRARAAREAYNAGLSDRTVSIMQADNPLQVIYGQAVVAPAFVATLTSGDRDQYKHLVAVWAAHECQGIDEVFLAGESVGALDANGWVTAGRFLTPVTATESETLPGGAAASVTLSRVPGQVLGVSAVFNAGTIDEQVQTLEPAQFTVAGAVVTLNAEYVSAWANKPLTVTYTWSYNDSAIRIRHHLGSDNQTADAVLLAEVPDQWSSSDRGRGLCYSVFTFKLDHPELQGGPPPITGLVRGKRVYDPREDSTQPGGSGLQRLDNPATWVAKSNAALCTADFLHSPLGKGARSNQVQWQSVAAAANVCDDEWAYESAGQARYSCDGAFRTNEDPDNTLDALCQSMAGFATFMGSWHVQAGSYTAPVMHLTDADNAGAVEIVPAPAGDQVMNGLRGRFYNPQAFDQVTDYPPYVNSAFMAEDGGPLMGDLDLPFTRSAARCHQLARIQVERSRGMMLVYPAKLRAWVLRPGQRITLTCALLGINAQVFRLVKREFSPGRAVLLSLQQDDPSYYDEADAPATLPPPTNSGTSPYQVAAPVNLEALSGPTTVLRDDDGTVVSRVRLQYDASADVLVHSAGSLQVEYRRDTETDWRRHADAPGNSTTMPLMGLVDERPYVIRARWRNVHGTVSDWRSAVVMTQGPSLVEGGGAPGAPALAARLSTYSASFAADSTGLVDAGQSFPVSFVVMLGSTDDTSNWTVSRTSSHASITTTLAGATVTITGMGAAIDTGWVDLTATRAGQPAQTLRMNLSKAKRAAPSSGPVANVGSLYAQHFGISPNDVLVSVEFLPDGRVQKLEGSTLTHISNWYLPNTAGAGSGYQVQFTRIAGHDVDVNNGALSTGRWVTLTDDTNGFSSRSATVGYSVRTAAGAAVADGVIYLQTDIEI